MNFWNSRWLSFTFAFNMETITKQPNYSNYTQSSPQADGGRDGGELTIIFFNLSFFFHLVLGAVVGTEVHIRVE